MKCLIKACPGNMETRQITHTFFRRGHPMVIEGIPAHICPICGYTVLDLEILDYLLSFDPEEEKPVRMAPVYRLETIPMGAQIA
ncbi:MAG: YgiT-type zinc finger protein [Chloroflexi bacterium]|nr:YgiT-type zinc finger protein [Chloroflexota bacterium]